MVESSDLQSAVQRTQAMERIQQLQNQQEELNRKRFELEMARQRAEKGKKVIDTAKAEQKRVQRDRYDGSQEESEHEKAERDTPPGQDEGQVHSLDPQERGGHLDVRI